MFAKSLFTGSQVFSAKSILNPVNYYYQQKSQTMYGSGANTDQCAGLGSGSGSGSTGGGSTGGGTGGGSTGGTVLFNSNTITALDIIQLNYVKKMADRNYLAIPSSMEEYLLLNNIVANEITSQTNANLRRLLQLANDAMSGALHSKTLNTDNTDLNLQNLLLNRRIEDILSGKNEVKAMGSTEGEFVITKTFKLAPLYSYYIYLYGMPAYGVGFDPAKLNILATMLQKYNINPYG
jgi:hypothetical protein